MKTQELSYWKSITHGSKTMWTGLKLAFKHLADAKESRTPIGVEDKDYFKQETGIVTLQYPYESLPVPDNGRYRLHNEIDDCIVCDKCAKICPVDCIDIEPIRSPEEIGRTSDDTPKRIHAAKFDIDMAKCCFCGLCTTVCPTECLTMTKAYDFSEYDVKDHNYSFAEMTPLQILEAQQKLEIAEKEKEAAKAQKIAASGTQPKVGTTGKAKPAFRPKVKPVAKSTNKPADTDDPKAKALALMKAKAKPAIPKPTDEKGNEEQVKATRPKPVLKVKPSVKPATQPSSEGASAKTSKPKPVIRSRPVTKPKEDSAPVKPSGATGEKKKIKPVMRPKPVIKKPKSDGDQ